MDGAVYESRVKSEEREAARTLETGGRGVGDRMVGVAVSSTRN